MPLHTCGIVLRIMMIASIRKDDSKDWHMEFSYICQWGCKIVKLVWKTPWQLPRIKTSKKLKHTLTTRLFSSTHRYLLKRNENTFTQRFVHKCLIQPSPGNMSINQIRSDQSLSHVRLCDPMNRSTPGLPVHHQLPEFTQTHVHRVSDAIQPSHPLSSPSPLAPNPSHHRSLFQ